MADKKAEIIHEYEELKNIPEEFRFTEYVEAYGSFLIKMGLDPERIEDRYNAALLLKAQKNSDKFQGIMEITLQHNIPDTAEYSLKNIDEMLNSFLDRDEKVRKIGLKKDDGQPVYLLKIRDTDILPEYLHIPDDIPDKEEFKSIRHEWFVKIVYIHEHRLEDQTKSLLNIANSKLAPKQEKYNYVKEFKRKIQATNVIKDEQLEGFDFRQIALQNHIFINCNLKNANFSWVDLSGVLFLNCNMDGTVFYGAQLNDCKMLSGQLKQVIDIYKKFA